MEQRAIPQFQAKVRQRELDTKACRLARELLDFATQQFANN